MGIFDRFPYSSTHEMNLDFMLGKATEIAEDMQTVTTGMAQVQAGLSAISEKTEQATQAAAHAAQSASSIEGSVTAAEEAAEEAQRHNESAQTWANNAMTYKADCQRAASEAAASSTAAAQAATAAAASEDTVATYAQAANASAQSAANNNDSAHQYANQASASASNATFHSSNAQTAATNAQTAATNANTSATNASASADRAASLKTDVETLHRMCVAAVDQAAEQAVAAANSAAQAAATKTDVENLVESLPEDFTDLNNTVNQLSDEIDDIKGSLGGYVFAPVKVMVSDISGEGVQNGYIDSTGKFNSSASWVATGYIRTDALESIMAHVHVFSTVPIVAFYDEYKVFLTTATSQTTAMQDYNITIPQDAHYMRLSMFKSDPVQYYAYNINKTKENALVVNQLNDALYGKKLGAVGDSITIGTYSAPGMTYINQIANAHNMTVDNQAIWGSVFPTGKMQAGNPQGSIYSQIDNLANDCDMIIISGGINDADYQADASYWGEISGGYTATLDTTTFCGAFEGTLKAALDKFKGKPILFVFEHRMTQEYQSEYGQHFANVQYPRMIEMLNKWGVPYADLFHDMPSIKLIPGYIDLYSFDDLGIHPNVAGYRKFYVPRVESALQAIVN